MNTLDNRLESAPLSCNGEEERHMHENRTDIVKRPGPSALEDLDALVDFKALVLLSCDQV